MPRRALFRAVLVAPLIAASVPFVIAGTVAHAEPSGKPTEFNVLGAAGASTKSVEAAVRGAGGTILARNTDVGLFTVRAPRHGFGELVTDDPAVAEAALARAIGTTSPDGKPDAARSFLQQERREATGTAAVTRGAAAARLAAARTDPLDSRLWGLRMVRSDLARTKQAGDRRVKVGVLDTGIDGTHPDIAPNFNRALSRNFVRDIPVDENGKTVDGPCEFRGCVDPVDHDDDGHGTHVAGTIAAAANGLGVSGVAPKVSLVSVRAGQDSGFFFLQPTVDALTYAGDAGLDVINMSFFVDPWLYNCTSNPADSPAEQAQQRTILTSLRRALSYAHGKGVTMVAALGNEHEDIGAPQDDTTSPDYPEGTAHPRKIDNASCFSLPAEDPNVISVSALGPSKAKADYSNYGTEKTAVSAPGGFGRDYFGTPRYSKVDNLVLSTYPRNVALAAGNIDADGNVTAAGKSAGVQRSCRPNGKCGYYQYLAGTSMASPHAAGVAALIVSQYGRYSGGSVFMSPNSVKRVLEGTASATPCPTPRTVSYENIGDPASYTATCKGGRNFNGFYGHGIVDAYSAVTGGAGYLG